MVRKRREPVPPRPCQMDIRWMRVALNEALRGRGTTSPNPMVGAVVAAGDRLLGKGFHRFAGGPHAEVEALRALRRVPPDATLYVTMEPCCTHGKTPPCTDLIIRRGVRRVVIGCLDPNPRHHGRAVKILRDRGVEVRTGADREACKRLNPAFTKHIVCGLPFVVAKMAMTLDGKIAARTGDSRWISCSKSRDLVQRMRHDTDAILAGAGTVIKDNPRLTVRKQGLPPKPRELVRIVADGTLSVSPKSRIFKEAKGHTTWIATTTKALRLRGKKFARCAVDFLRVKQAPHGILMRDLFCQLGQRGITHVLIEGGPTLLASCLNEGVVDRLSLFIAPKIAGGLMAPGPVGGKGVSVIAKALACRKMRVSRVGQDLLVEAEIK